MSTQTGLIIIAAAILALAVVATIQSVFAQEITEYNLVNPFAPGQVTKKSDGEIAAKTIAPGQRAGIANCPSCDGASIVAPGHLKRTLPPP